MTVETLTDPMASLVLVDPMVEEASGFSERFVGLAKPAPLKPNHGPLFSKGSSPLDDYAFDHMGLSDRLSFDQMSLSDGLIRWAYASSQR